MWKILSVGAAVLCVAVVGGGYAYRQHQISTGIASYQKGDFQDAYSALKPFSGWGDPAAQGILADIDLKEQASNFFKSGSQGASANTGRTGGEGVENDQQALGLATRSAEAGDPFGEFVLSMIYMNGWSINENDKNAFIWARQSAQQGSGLAAMEVGTLYEFGKGVGQDSGQANTYFQKALAAGVLQADDLLGLQYASGDGVPQDPAKAISYYQDAANHGDDTGEFNLGDDYLTGTGVTQDVNKAQTYLLAAAEQGNGGAMNDLGLIYSKGDASVGYSKADEATDYPPQDIALAYMFYDMAVANGYQGAEDNKSQSAQSMTSDQIASAQGMASKWQTGTPLPTTVSYEDWAPEILFNGASTAPNIYQTSHNWFSRAFTSNGHKKYVVFSAINSDSAHTSGANISAVTFDDDPLQSNEKYGIGQLNFTQIGSWGEVPQPSDPAAPYLSLKRIATLEFDLNNNRTAFLVPDGWSGGGDVSSYYDILVYDQNGNSGTGQWENLGQITTNDAVDLGCPGNGQTIVNQGCYSWSGTLSMIPAHGNDWPKFVVHQHGDDFDPSTNKKYSDGNLTYQFNGQQYVANH